MGEAKKFCNGCVLEKSVNEFPPSKQNKDGYYPYCRLCKNFRIRERRAKKTCDEGRTICAWETKNSVVPKKKDWKDNFY